MIGLSVFDLLVLLVVFGGVAGCRLAVILIRNRRISLSLRSPIRTSKCLPRSRFRRFSRRRPRSMMLSQLSPLIFAHSVAQCWRQTHPSAKTAELPSTTSDFSGTGIKQSFGTR